VSEGRPEVAWFSALCDDDYEYLGLRDASLRSSWAHCRDTVTTAEASGSDNVLPPSGYALGIDGVPFAGGTASSTTSHSTPYASPWIGQPRARWWGCR